mmetsp:Transcript_19044/g.38499  ORF Transcript_19044/g.38499 Transcript_19044/m.38499 type:complete len:106 (-) Transcript_19044:351-668(-)
MGHLLHAEAAPQEHAQLTVLCKHVVLGLERGRATNLQPLLSRVLHVERYPPVPLRLGEDLVDGCDLAAEEGPTDTTTTKRQKKHKPQKTTRHRNNQKKSSDFFFG